MHPQEIKKLSRAQKIRLIREQINKILESSFELFSDNSIVGARINSDAYILQDGIRELLGETGEYL